MENGFQSIWTHMYDVAFTQDWVDAGGVRTRYIVAGPRDAPAVIILHGTAGSWENGAANIRALAEHFRVYSIDMIGCGLTDKIDRDLEIPVYVDHVIAFMDALGIDKASFLGISLGSWISARLALTYPERADRIIFVSAAGHIELDDEARDIRERRSAAADTPNWQSVRYIFEHLFHDEKAIPDDLVALRLNIYGRPEMQKSMPYILAIVDPEAFNRNRITEEEAERLTNRSLLIASVDHEDIFLKTTKALAQRLPNAEVVEMPGTKHWAQFEDPKTFNRVAIDFLSKP